MWETEVTIFMTQKYDSVSQTQNVNLLIELM